MANRYRVLGSFLTLFVFFSFSALGESRQSNPELFVYFEETNLPVSFLNAPKMAYNSGIVSVNVAALSQPDSLPPRAILPNGRQYDVLTESVEWRGETSFKWTGVFVGLDGEVLNAVLTVRNQMTAGIIFGEMTEFQLVPVSSGYHRLVQADPGTYSECGGSIPVSAIDDPSGLVPRAYETTDVPQESDGNTVIDVLLVYTAEARIAAGGTEQIELVLQNAIDFANQSYLNSSVDQEVNLIATGENGFSESGKTSGEMLNEIRSSPAFHTLRDAYGADVVGLVTSTLEGNVGGIGFLMTIHNLGSWFAPYAYSVNRLSNLHWTLTHEMGHNMGLNHEPASASLDPEDASYPYAFGHKVEGVFRTIMSYSCTEVWCPRVQYFSNPNLDYSGEPTGIVNERENWQVLNNTAPIVADFRTTPSCGSLSAPEGLDYPSASETGECTISWDSVEPNAAKYTLQRSTSPSFSGAITIYSGSLTFFEQGELSPNNYYYRIRAENCDGTSSWTVGPALVVGEAPGLDNVEFSTNLAGNQAEHGQGFLLIGEASSGYPVTFQFFTSTTPSKPGSPFDTSTEDNCSSGCDAFSDFTAPAENMTLYFWLDVSSNGATEYRSLTVQVQGDEPPALDNVEFSTNLAGNQAEHGQGFLLIGEASSGYPVTFQFFTSTTPSKPGSPFDTSTEDNCSSGCDAFSDFTAPAENMTLYFWLDVSSNGATEYRSLTVQVQGDEPPALDNVEFSTNLAGNQAEHGQGFLLIGEASSGYPVTFQFFTSTTPSKPGSPFDTSTEDNCSSGCDAFSDFTAPAQDATLYFWLDVSSNGATEYRSLTVQVQGDEPPALDNVEFSTNLAGNQAEHGQGFLLIGEASSGYPVTFLFYGSTTATKPVSPFDTSNENNCSSGCEVISDFTAPAQDATLYFWLDVSSNGTTAYRSLTVLVDSGEDPPPLPDTQADLEIIGPSSVSAGIGQSIELGFEVENRGPSACHNVRLTMTLPEAGHVNTTAPSCQIGSNLSCDFGTLEAGESETLQVTLTLNEEGVFTSFLEVEGDEEDPDREDNEAEVEYIVKKIDLLFFPYSLRTGSPFPQNPYAGVALFNPNESPTDVEFTAFDDIGQQLDRIMLSELAGRENIPAMGQTALIPTEIFGQEGVSSVIASGNPHPVKLFFMLGDYNLNTLDGVAGPLPESSTLHFPIARSNEEEEVVLFLFNSNSEQSVETIFELYDGDGDLVAETLRSLPPQGSLAETLEQLFGLAEIDGYVKVLAEGKVKGFELYSQSKGLSALVAQPPVEGTLLIAPHFFTTAGGDTELRLQNLGQRFVSIAVKGYTDDGSLLGSYEFLLPRRESFARNVTEFLPLEATGTEVMTGYLIIELTGSFLSTPMVSGSVTFTGFEGNTIATLPLVSSGNRRTRFLHVAQSDDLSMFTGLAILNLGKASANVNIKVYNKDGQVVEEKSLNDLSPGSRVVDILSSSTFFPGFQQVGGHLEVVSDEPVVIFALFGDYNGRFLSAIEGQSF